MSILVGVDAGGTSTVVAVQSEEARTTHEFPAASASVVGAARGGEALVDALRTALGEGIPHAIVVGAAGAGRQSVAAAIAHTIRTAYPTSHIDVVDDARIALRAAVASGDGVALVAGTGSIAYAEYGDERVRAGGYGYAFGDEGSGFSIGAAALRHAAKVRDGRVPPDELSAQIAPDGDAFDALMLSTYEPGATVTRVAAFAAPTLALASGGVRSANKIVQAAALELFELVKTVVRRAPERDEDLPVALCGGLLGTNSLLTYLLETRIAHELPHVHPIKAPPSPVEGALALARAALV